MQEDFPWAGTLLTIGALIGTVHYFVNSTNKEEPQPPQEGKQQQKELMLPPIGVVGAGAIGTICGLALCGNPDQPKQQQQQQQQQRVVLVGRQSLMNAVQANDQQIRCRDKSRGQKDPTIFSVQTSTATTIADKSAASSSGENNTSDDDNNKNKNGGGIIVTESMQDLIKWKCSIIIVATKSVSTKSIGEELANILPLDSNVTIFSFQNGVRNASILRECFKGTGHQQVRVLACMVGFNASWGDTITSEPNSNLFNRNTDGGIKVERPTAITDDDDDKTTIAIHSKRADDLVSALTKNHIPSQVVTEIAPQMYSKLLINLFNAINALAGQSTPSTLESKGYRRVFAAAITEGLTIYQHKGIRTATFRGLPPKLLPMMGVLPETIFWFIFRVIAKTDDNARGSMLQDFDRRPTNPQTEIDYLCGEIVQLGKDVGIETPVNSSLVRLIKQAEKNGKGSPKLSPNDMLRECGLLE